VAEIRAVFPRLVAFYTRHEISYDEKMIPLSFIVWDNFKRVHFYFWNQDLSETALS
jgi:hypothetical protein